MDAQVFVKCVTATASVASCVKKIVVITFWKMLSYIISFAPIGSAARNKAYVAVAMSLSPPQ